MSKQIISAVSGGLVLLGLLVASDAIFILEPYQKAIVLEFGKPRQEIHKPGVYFKVPFMQNVERYDVRNRTFEVCGEQVITSDKKRVIVDTYLVYHIAEPVLFYKKLHTHQESKARLHALMVSALRGCVGKFDFEGFLKHNRQEVMDAVEEVVRKDMASFGLTLVDLRIARSELPEQNSQAIYRRMVSERQRIAKRVRAEGKEKGERVCAEARKEADRIIADGNKEAQRISGEGLAIAAQKYADMAKSDKRLFQVMRSKRFVQRVVAGKDMPMYVSAENTGLLSPLAQLVNGQGKNRARQ